MNALVDRCDLGAEAQVLAGKKIEAKSGNRRNAIVRYIANNLEQLGSAIAALRRDDAEFGHMPADCIR